jgi:putative integral membrane protein (TIGR02587 family)
LFPKNEPLKKPAGEPRSQSDHRRGDEVRAQGPNRKFAIGLARAFGGAIIFSLPLLMTMEMWYLGSYITDFRLALFLVLTIPLLIGLSHYIGFENTFGFKDDALDAFVACAVGFVAASVALLLFAVIQSGTHFDEIVGKITIQAVPGSIGAMLAQSQFGREKKKRDRREGYGYQLFIMAVGALFLALNVAPTEEIVLIAQQMTDWHTLALAFASLLIMHAFVYSLEFSGTVAVPKGTPFWNVFLRFTVGGYALALIISMYVLWTFGRIDGVTLHQLITTVIVLGFPAAVGAAAARLIL